jgi:putative transposase
VPCTTQQSGKPNENAYIESFNGKFRDECLNEHLFITMAQARRTIEAWRIEYNTERPHSSLGDMTLEAFAARRREAVSSTADSKLGRDNFMETGRRSLQAVRSLDRAPRAHSTSPRKHTE